MITQYDLKLMLQKPILFEIKLEVLNENGIILDVLKGVIVGGSSSIDSMSTIRRTFSSTIIPTLFDRNDSKIKEDGLIWINKEIRLYIGITDLRTKNIIYYPQGQYIYSNTSGNYDATTNELIINCNDCMSKLDGTKNGQIGSLTTLIPAYDEDENGNPIRYNIIREAFIKILNQLGNIKNYFIDDIGEYNAMPQYNDDWQNYRNEHPLWNTIPYDLEFSTGCTVLSILEKLRDLYPNYEMFFDIYNTFICRMIPSCYKDDILFNNEFLQDVLIKESHSNDFLKVRNICEVWGKVIETDFYTDVSTYTNNVYNCSINGYDEKYYNGDIVAIKILQSNSSSSKLSINNLGNIEILDENTDLGISANTLTSNSVYAFKIKSKKINNESVFKAYLLGQWQAHGLNVLTDGTIGEIYTFSDGVKLKKFSKEYFQKKYNCQSVEFEIIQNSPFTVQKIGEILDVKNGSEYDSITSDSLALSCAKWENWRNARLTDNLTLTTNLIPFYDVNIKVSYQKHDSDSEEQFIIKSVSHDFSSWTSTLNLIKFYPLYDDIVKEMGTYKMLSNYKYGTLSKYTYHEVKNITGGETY